MHGLGLPCQLAHEHEGNFPVTVFHLLGGSCPFVSDLLCHGFAQAMCVWCPRSRMCRGLCTDFEKQTLMMTGQLEAVLYRLNFPLAAIFEQTHLQISHAAGMGDSDGGP